MPQRTLDALREQLARPPLLLDGATGTELTRRGVETHLPLWSAAALLDHPDTVRAIHADYVQAGADIIVGNTFRTNERTLRRAGLAHAGARLNLLALNLVRRGAEHAVRRVFAAASVAPVEDCYRPDLVPPDDVLRDEHARMADWLTAAGFDLVWIETMNTAREARVAAEAVSARGLPLAVSFIVREDGALLGGDSLADAVAQVEPFGPLALGINCIPPDGMPGPLRILRSRSSRPLAAYAHLGNPQPITGWSFSSSMGPAEYARHARSWLATGVAIVGGCCGTTPAHIAAVRAAIDGAAQASAAPPLSSSLP